jgi:hypothetical protein
MAFVRLTRLILVTGKLLTEHRLTDKNHADLFRRPETFSTMTTRSPFNPLNTH